MTMKSETMFIIFGVVFHLETRLSNGLQSKQSKKKYTIKNQKNSVPRHLVIKIKTAREKKILPV